MPLGLDRHRTAAGAGEEAGGRGGGGGRTDAAHGRDLHTAKSWRLNNHIALDPEVTFEHALREAPIVVMRVSPAI